MINFNDLQVGQTVYIHLGKYSGCDDGGWLEVTIRKLVGNKEPNPGRTLVQVVSPWLECGWEIVDVEDIYPTPDFNITIETINIVRPVKDNRAYEFGIGGINNTEDYPAQYEVVGQQRIEMVKCDCGHTVQRILIMNASCGTACPDCYDRMS